MKNKGFTLTELLAVLVVLGVVAAISTPIIQKTLKNNKEKLYGIFEKQLISYAKDYSAENSEILPDVAEDSNSITVEMLKKSGMLQIDVVNPKTGNNISNQSYVKVTRKANNYVYEVHLYDLVDISELEVGAPTITLQSYSQTCNLNGACILEASAEGVSRQVIYNGKEIANVDTSKPGIYSVYYSKLENDKLGISIKSVTVPSTYTQIFTPQYYGDWSLHGNIGDSAPSNPLIEPPTGKEFYLGYDVSNGKISAAYVCFKRTSTGESYCLRGAGATFDENWDVSEESPYYVVNKDIIRDFYAEIADTDVCVFNDVYAFCEPGNLDVDANSGGDIGASNNNTACNVAGDGSFECYAY